MSFDTGDFQSLSQAVVLAICTANSSKIEAEYFGFIIGELLDLTSGTGCGLCIQVFIQD